MEQKFCIYPKQCKTECDVIRQTSEKVTSYKTKVQGIQKSIAQLRGGGYSNIVSYLGLIITDMENEKRGLDSLRAALEQSIQLYVRTESKIAGNHIIRETIKDAQEGREDTLADIILDIGDFRSNWWEVAIESFFTKGIFDDYVIDDLRKVLSGTYISSYWKEGSLYFKLHYDDLTNRQAIEWLTENVGGKWDDYLARNMKNNGFSVFDMDGGVTSKIKYFDEITDIELHKYVDKLKGLKKLDAISFGKTLFKEFKPLDDFNYKEFKDLGNLGKAGKILGTVGTVLTVGGDVVDNFYDAEQGTWSFSGNQVADCVCDVVIDISTGAGSTAIGAAVGSLIAPPVGTVVGAGVGMLVDVAANNVGIWDVDGDGQKDSLIDMAKIVGHVLVDKGEKFLDNVIDWGANLGSDIGNWLGEAFAF